MTRVRNLDRGLLRMPFRSVVWFLPLAFTLHNVEEWIWMPGWSGGLFRSPADSTAFRFALVVLTIAGWVITFLASRSRAGGPSMRPSPLLRSCS